MVLDLVPVPGMLILMYKLMFFAVDSDHERTAATREQ